MNLKNKIITIAVLSASLLSCGFTKSRFTSPSEFSELEIYGIMNGVQQFFSGKDADTFISPLGEMPGLKEISLEASVPVELIDYLTDYTSSGPHPTISLIDNNNGNHTVVFTPALDLQEWLKVTIFVRAKESNYLLEYTFWVAHLPADVNQNGNVSIADPTAYGQVYQEYVLSGNKNFLALLDMNRDGVIDDLDYGIEPLLGSFKKHLSGIGPEVSRAWNGLSLPPKPE